MTDHDDLDPLAPPAGHPGWDTLLRLHLGELPSAAAEKAQAHLAECAACAARLGNLSTGDARFKAERPFAVLEAALNSRKSGPSRAGVRTSLAAPRPASRWAVLGVAGLLAAAAGVFILVKPPEEATPPPSERLKAGLALSFDVERDGRPVPGDPRATYRKGDRIQVRYSSPVAGQLVLVSLDGRGEVSVFYDDRGRSLPVEPGAGRPLPGSVVLDDAPRAERLVACFSSNPLDSAEVVAAGRRALTAAGGDPTATGKLDLPCAQADLVLRKE